MKNILKLLEDITLPGRNEDGSFTRLGFSETYFKSIERTEEYMKQLGLDTTIDGVGNLRGRWVVDENAPTIMLASHMDTVQNGGMYDGALGVAVSLSVIDRLKEQGFPIKNNIEVVAFNAEEGSEIGGTFGSRALMGKVSIDDTNRHLFKKYNIDEKVLASVPVDPNVYKAYLELHIEQGSKLDIESIPIGIVSGIVGISRYRITATGEANHAGTTIMSVRRDALVAMSKLIVKIDTLAQSFDENMVATVGVIENDPNQVNVISGQVEIILEVRHIESKIIDQFVEAVAELFPAIPNVDFTIERTIRKASTQSDPELMQLVEQVCQDLNTQYTVMPSGAGHDANAVADLIPSCMIFVPSVAGISHNYREFTREEDIVKGFEVLYHTVVQLST